MQKKIPYMRKVGDWSTDVGHEYELYPRAFQRFYCIVNIFPQTGSH